MESLNKFPEARLVMTPGAVSKANPTLAAAAMELIAIWSYIELIQLDIISNALESDFVVVNAILTRIESPAARDAALKAAVEHHNPTHAALVMGVWQSVILPTRAIRNTFAHQLWALSPDIADALILIDPGALADRNARSRSQVSQHFRDGVPLRASPGIDRERGRVFRADDIAKLILNGYEAHRLALMAYLVVAAIPSQFVEAHSALQEARDRAHSSPPRSPRRGRQTPPR